MKFKKSVLLFFFILFSLIPTASAKVDMAIIGAMDCEVQYFQDKLEHKRIINKRNLKITKGKIGKNTIVITKSGMGKVNAATTTQFLIDKFSPKYIVNMGVSGALSPNLKIGDVMVAKSLVQHDFDVSILGYAKGGMDDNNPKEVTYYTSDKNLNDMILKVSDKIQTGIIASGDAFISDTKKKQAIRKEFNADMVEMEGAAVAQTATLNNIPFAVLRVSSDMASGGNDDFYQFREEMALYCSKIIEKVLETNKL